MRKLIVAHFAFLVDRLCAYRSFVFVSFCFCRLVVCPTRRRRSSRRNQQHQQHQHKLTILQRLTSKQTKWLLLLLRLAFAFTSLSHSGQILIPLFILSNRALPRLDDCHLLSVFCVFRCFPLCFSVLFPLLMSVLIVLVLQTCPFVSCICLPLIFATLAEESVEEEESSSR